MRQLSLFTMVMLLVGLSGCSTIGKLLWGEKTAKLQHLKVVALPNANQGQATELDLVFIYASDIAKTLPGDAPTWFKQRSAIQAKYAGDLDVVSLEVPAGFVVQSVKLPARHADALQVQAYANYVAAAGQYPLVLTRLKDVVLTLQEDKFVFSAGDQ
jgi:type VI secretion system protein